MSENLYFQTRRFLDHLRRGGAVSHFWMIHKSGKPKETLWFNAADDLPLPIVAAADWNVYFGVNPCTVIPADTYDKARQVRSRNAIIAAINTLYGDFDAKNFNGDLEATLTHILSLELQPSVIIFTGGGYHAYWLLKEPVIIIDDATRVRMTSLQERWVKYVQADPAAKDLARVMRLPETLNQKYDPPVRVEILADHFDLERIYTLEELDALLPAAVTRTIALKPPQLSNEIRKLISLNIDLVSPFEIISPDRYVEKAVERSRTAGRNATGLWLAQQLRDNNFSKEEALLVDYQARVQNDKQPAYTWEEYVHSVHQAYENQEKREPSRPVDELMWEATPIRVTGPADALLDGLNQPAPADTTFAPEDDTLAPSGDQTGEKKSKKKSISDLRIAKKWIAASALQGRALEFGQGAFRAYNDGFWQALTQEEVEGEVTDIQDLAEAFGYNTTAGKRDSAISLAKSRLARYMRPWDENKNVLVLSNGTLDLETLKMRDHSPEDYQTSSLPYAYDPSATCPNAMKVIDRLGAGKRVFIQFLGYTLTTDTSLEKMLWVVGKPGAGKSTLILIAETLVSDCNKAHLSMADLKAGAFGLEQINGKRLLISTEQPSGFFEGASGLNAISSGESIKANRKHKDHVTFRPFGKVLFAMNKLPRIDDADDGTFRRLILLIMPLISKELREPAMKSRIKEEGPGILNLALEGLRDLRSNGMFDEPDSVKQAVEEYEQEADLMGLFIEEALEMRKNSFEGARTLYNSYRYWNTLTGHKPINQHTFSRMVKDHGLVQVRKKKGLFWMNVNVRPEFRTPDYSPPSDDGKADIPF